MKPCTDVYLMEDPVFFDPIAGKLKLTIHRASLKDYFVWLENAVGVVNDSSVKIKKVHYVTREKIAERGNNIFDYMIGVCKQLMMFRPSHMWEYGTAAYDYTYAGLPVKFYESPGFILGYRYIRDNCKRDHKYNFRLFAEKIMADIGVPVEVVNNKLRLGVTTSSKIVDVSFEITDTYKAAVSHVNKHYKTANARANTNTRIHAINCTEADKLLEIFIDYVLPEYNPGDLSLITPALHIGLLTPKYVVRRILVSEVDSARTKLAIMDIIKREYLRVAYLTNSVTTKPLDLSGQWNDDGVMKKICKRVLEGKCLGATEIEKIKSTAGSNNLLIKSPMYYSWMLYDFDGVGACDEVTVAELRSVPTHNVTA